MQRKNNPYAAPESDVIVEPVGLPSSQPPISASTLRLAGFLSIVYAALSIPLTLAALDLTQIAAEMYVPLSVVNLILWVFLMRLLVHYLEYRYSTDRLRTLFYLVAIVGVAAAITGTLAYLQRAEELTLSMIVSAVLMVPYGILFTVFGFRIKNCSVRNRTVWLLGWLSIVSGIAVASIVLVIIAVVLGYVWDIALAVLFFTSANELSEASKSANKH